MVKILSPVSPVAFNGRRLAPRLSDLAGVRVSVLDNSKANAGLLLESIVRGLVENDNAVRGIAERKSSASIAATPSTLERLRQSSDLVLAGSADCGSCSSGSVQDVIALEGLGVPCVLIGTDTFAPLIEQLSAWLGLPDMQRALAPHPLGGIDDEAVMGKAARLVELVRDLVTVQS